MSNEIKNYFVQGAILIDVDGASLNNLGTDKSIADKNKILTNLDSHHKRIPHK